MFYEDETSKHKKKQASNTSDASRKADHKHIYEKCLLQGDHLYLGRRCSVCGKTVVDKYFLTRKIGPNRHVMISDAEVSSLHKDLPTYANKEES